MSNNHGVGAVWETEQEVRELRSVLDRAMNTWEPKQWPAWLSQLSEAVDRSLKRYEAEKSVG